MKKILLKLLPFLLTIIAGILFYKIAYIWLNFQDLLINLSATFLAIPLVYMTYEVSKYFSQKKLNSKIFDFVKKQVDSEILSITSQLQKIVYTYEQIDKTFDGLSKFLLTSSETLLEKISQNQYLGFQVLKSWNFSEAKLNQLLKNNFILKRIDEEQIIVIIDILESLEKIELIKQVEDLFLETGEIAKGFRVENGQNMNPENGKLADRCMLLKSLGDDKYQVHDFGDIKKYNIEKCLHFFKVNNTYKTIYHETIYELIENINRWLDLTGNEFIVDPRIFKIRKIGK